MTGVNDSGIAIGYYYDSAAKSHGYIYEISSHRYLSVDLGVAGATSVTPTGINDSDNSVGFFSNASGKERGFLLKNGSRRPVILSFPGSSATNPYGINKYGVVVGAYTVGAKTFGFTWSLRRGYQKISYPGSVSGTTVVVGINSAGDLVGFYTDSHGNSNGFLARP